MQSTCAEEGVDWHGCDAGGCDSDGVAEARDRQTELLLVRLNLQFTTSTSIIGIVNSSLETKLG